MSEETIIVEVEPESIKPHLIDVKLSSTVLSEELPDNIDNSEHPNFVVKDTINSVKDEQFDKKDVKKSLVWDEQFDGRHVRRHSASLFGANRKLVVPSRYRGGSIGSCHDMCKFGHRNTSEVKPKSHLKKTPLSVSSSQGKGPMKIVSSVDNRKKSVVRRLSFPASQMHVAEVKHAGKEKQTTAGSVKTVNEQKEKCLVGDEKRSLVSSVRGFQEISAVIKDEEKSLRSKPPVKKPARMNSKISREPSSSFHLKNHQTNRHQEAKAKLPEDVPEKTLYMIEPDVKCTPAETSQKAPLQRKKLPKTQGGSYIGTRKGSKATPNGSLSKSLFSSSSKSFKWKSEKLDDSELVIKHTDTVYGGRKSKSSIQEATSYTPKLELGAPKAKQNGKHNSHLIKALLPAVDKPSKSKEEVLVLGKTGDTVSSKSKSKPNTPKMKPSTSNPRSKLGTPKVRQDVEPKTKVVSTRGAKSQNGEGQGFVSVWKMKFRRGKVVSLPSGNNSPKILKFRRPRSLSDSRHGESAGKANYKRNEVGEDDHDPHKDGAEAVKVVLRRHEVTYKKDDVDLNNVIEETASKLVKTRKSKVKALVGAFETVMLLRDRKPATDTS